jgi:murein DD-endopeptidase MepM/ murein hydrolase activator NlpD
VPLGRSCVGAAVAALTDSRGNTVVLKGRGSGAAEYPASHPYLTVDSASTFGSRCSTEGVSLAKVSLFGGAVTAKAVSATDGRGNASGLAVNGVAVHAGPGQTVGVGNWGLLAVGAKNGRLAAPLALRLVRAHGVLPAGTTIYIGFAAQALPKPHGVHPPVVAHHHHHGHPQHHPKPVHKPQYPQPLKWTPRLGIDPSRYVFPVDGGGSFIDTYGAGRPDVYDGWHHGDDIFAPLGTPILAVANGTLSPLGWDGLGGWRLWLTDHKGNSFYYAHLAGYSRVLLQNRHVRAGQVIGFLGRTGDAFTTAPHLHFEIHPHNKKLKRLGYDGAVNPTTYLQSWHIVKVPQNKIPGAVRLQAPAGTPSQEAAVVWRELLKARHLMPDGELKVARTPSLRRPFPPAQQREQYVSARRLSSPRISESAAATPAGQWPLITFGLALAVLAGAGSLAVARRRRSA